MLEFPNIQSRGFRNLKEGDQVTGFQVPVRLTYYGGYGSPYCVRPLLRWTVSVLKVIR
jgi:hypothetical protein